MTIEEKKLLSSFDERMVALYSKRSRQPASKIRQMMADETFLDAANSVRLGLADRIVEASTLRIVAPRDAAPTAPLASPEKVESPVPTTPDEPLEETQV